MLDRRGLPVCKFWLPCLTSYVTSVGYSHMVFGVPPRCLGKPLALHLVVTTGVALIFRFLIIDELSQQHHHGTDVHDITRTLSAGEPQIGLCKICRGVDISETAHLCEIPFIKIPCTAAHRGRQEADSTFDLSHFADVP